MLRYKDKDNFLGLTQNILKTLNYIFKNEKNFNSENARSPQMETQKIAFMNFVNQKLARGY